MGFIFFIIICQILAGIKTIMVLNWKKTWDFPGMTMMIPQDHPLVISYFHYIIKMPTSVNAVTHLTMLFLSLHQEQEKAFYLHPSFKWNEVHETVTSPASQHGDRISNLPPQALGSVSCGPLQCCAWSLLKLWLRGCHQYFQVGLDNRVVGCYFLCSATTVTDKKKNHLPFPAPTCEISSVACRKSFQPSANHPLYGYPCHTAELSPPSAFTPPQW